jgi:hypothetical protein
MLIDFNPRSKVAVLPADISCSHFVLYWSNASTGEVHLVILAAVSVGGERYGGFKMPMNLN